MVGFVLVLAIFTTRLFPGTPAARWFMRWLVDKPLDVLARIERKHIIMVGILLFLVTLGGEMVLMLGSWDMAVFYALDTSMFIDALIATWTIATVSRGQRVWTAIRSRLPAANRPRARRTRSVVRKWPSSANDDDGPGAFALAA